MLIEIGVAIVAGLVSGTITGLTPGIHANLVATVAVTLALRYGSYVSPVALAVFLITLGVVHSVLDVIPSVFLGAPDPSTVLSVLPGHTLLLSGLGFEAVVFAFCGSFFGLVGVLLFTPLIAFLFVRVQELIRPYLFWILVAVVLWSFWKEEERMWAMFLFFVTGLLGVVLLSSSVPNVLFPLLTGLFGISSLLLSLGDAQGFPEQQLLLTTTLSIFMWIRNVLSGLLAGVVSAFLPGLGPAHTAGIATLFAGKQTPQSFLALNGTIGTVSFAVSLITLISLGKARNGIVVSLQRVVLAEHSFALWILLFTALAACCFAVLVGLSVLRGVIVLFSCVPYRVVAVSVIVFLVVLAFVLCGWIGLFILVCATLLGLLPSLSGCAHHHAMGCLLFPVLLFFA